MRTEVGVDGDGVVLDVHEIGAAERLLGLDLKDGRSYRFPSFSTKTESSLRMGNEVDGGGTVVEVNDDGTDERLSGLDVEGDSLYRAPSSSTEEL